MHLQTVVFILCNAVTTATLRSGGCLAFSKRALIFEIGVLLNDPCLPETRLTDCRPFLSFLSRAVGFRSEASNKVPRKNAPISFYTSVRTFNDRNFLLYYYSHYYRQRFRENCFTKWHPPRTSFLAARYRKVKLFFRFCCVEKKSKESRSRTGTLKKHAQARTPRMSKLRCGKLHTLRFYITEVALPFIAAFCSYLLSAPR